MKRQAMIEEKIIRALMDLDELDALLEDSIQHDIDHNKSEAKFASGVQTITRSAGLKLSLAYENILTRYERPIP